MTERDYGSELRQRYPSKVTVLTPEEVEQVVTAVQEIELDKDFLDAAYRNVEDLLASQK